MANIKVVSNVLRANDAIANENREKLDAHSVRAINIVSAPGSGKTTLLQRTIAEMTDKNLAVLVGDLQTSRDAERLQTDRCPAIQINTGRGCHLSAEQVTQGINELDLDALDILIVENIGNMVCPAGYDLGEHKRVALLSTPEGDDKVAKYPTLFQSADLVILSKIDLAEILEFDVNRVKEDLAQLNTAAPLFQLSTKTGEGFDAWLNWLREI